MLPRQQSPLASQISLRAGLGIAICLMLTLPGLGWWTGQQVARHAASLAQQQQTSDPASPSGAATADPSVLRRPGDRIHRTLIESLYIHSETIPSASGELPLMTFRDRPVHQSGAALASMLDGEGDVLMLFAAVDGGFHLTAHSGWVASSDDGLGDKLSDSLLDATRLPPGESATRLVSAGDSREMKYLRPLRNSAGEVQALLVMSRPLPPAVPAAGSGADPAPGTTAAGMSAMAGSVKQNTARLETIGRWLGPASLGLSLLLVAVLVLIVHRTARTTLTPLKQLTTVLVRLGTGDLSAKAADPDPSGAAKTRNELSQLARSMNRMAEQTSQLIGTLRSGTQQVSSAASGLSEAARRIDEDAQRESRAAIGMAAAVEEMTTSITSVGQNAEEAKGLSQRAHELVAEGSAAVASATGQMHTINQTVSSTSDVIAQLGEQSRQISAIAAMIKEIAEQTNLLALNAAIEAARAGENGRGFSVVAEEVRRLAERTSDSTEQIRGMIDAIQNSADIAVDNMKSAVDCVQEGVQMVSHVGETIARIHEDASHVATAVDAIHIALREQNSASSSIAQQVDCVAQMSRETQHTASEAVQKTVEMENTARRMQEALEKFGGRKSAA